MNQRVYQGSSGVAYPYPVIESISDEKELIYPRHLGEGKLYGAQKNDFLYLLGLAYECKTMKQIKKTLLACLAAVCLTAQAYASEVQEAKWDSKSLIVDGQRVVPVMGEVHFSHIPITKWKTSHDVMWNTEGDYRGPRFYADGKGLDRTINTFIEDDKLVMDFTIKNLTHQAVSIEDSMASVRLGINTLMNNPKLYSNQFFPTMLRCEKTHLWGYFEAPNGRVLAIVSTSPIASWHNEYRGLGHHIRTVTLDLMHSLPLPSRHPQDLAYLAPLEEKHWRVYLIPVASVKDVARTVSMVADVPTVEVDRTTLMRDEITDVWINCGEHAKPIATIFKPSGKTEKVKLEKRDGRYHLCFIGEEEGENKLIVSVGTKQAEAIVYVRHPWSWYLQHAASEAGKMEQKACQHREGWMGFFSEYWALAYFPDSLRLAKVEADFHKFWDNMIDPATGFFYTKKKTWPNRPQNTAWMVSLLTARYAATHCEKDLKLAADWADMFISKFQLKSGAFMGYTALTLGSKFLYDLMWYEEPLAASSTDWKSRYERHRLSAEAAGRNIYEVGDLGNTEGEATYEDNQAGSAWSLLAMHALVDGSDKYLKRSLEIQRRHECLTQSLVPDGRFNGGTLRFWEAQYDVLIPHNMMNSPHGWTMRSQFGALYLYLLTGREYFLNVAFNAMGSCAQAIDGNTGSLRWAFTPDPYIKTRQFVNDPSCPGKGIYKDTVIGEQWIPTISKWWHVPETVSVAAFKKEGWSCDNDVHEHFRIMADQFAQNAFVIERVDGTLRSYNCTVKRKGRRLVITIADSIATRVHLNLNSSYHVKLSIEGQTYNYNVKAGMNWIGHGIGDHRIPSYYITR